MANARELVFAEPALAEMSARYGETRAPAVVMSGAAHCVLTNDVHVLPLARKLEKARLVLLEGGGHMPHHAAPDAVLAAIDGLGAAGAQPRWIARPRYQQRRGSGPR